jgi:CBS domain-containing protein
MSTLVRHVMAEAPKSLGPERSACDAAGMMAQHDIGSVPVVEDGELAGIVTDRDLAVRVLAKRRDPDTVILDEILTRSPATIGPDAKLSQARSLMAEERVGGCRSSRTDGWSG